MAVYKFRVTFEEYDDVSRDIEIKATQSFQDLHNAIQVAMGFDNSKLASFYQSDDVWRKGGIEYTLHATEGKAEMAATRLCDIINDPHQRFIYLFDENVLWSFYVELMKIAPDEKGAEYPRCVKKAGDAPKQYGISNLGKVSTDLDFLNEAIVAHGDDDDEEIAAMSAEGEERDSVDGVEEEVDEFANGEEEQTQEHEE